MPEFEIKRTGPGPMDCEVKVHPSDTDEHVIKVREALKDSGLEIKGVHLKNSRTPLFDPDMHAKLTAGCRAASGFDEMQLISSVDTAGVKKKYYESFDGLDSLSEFETPEEQAFRENLIGPNQPFEWMKVKPDFLYDGKPLPPLILIPSPPSPLPEQALSRLDRRPFMDLDINSAYAWQYVPYTHIWNVRCDYSVFKDQGTFMIRVVVDSQDKHNRRLRQLKKKMAHTKAINRPAVRAEYKATIAMRKQFQKHINSGLSIRDEDKPSYDWEALKKSIGDLNIRHEPMIVHLPR